jgi:hypothetical protein
MGRYRRRRRRRRLTRNQRFAASAAAAGVALAAVVHTAGTAGPGATSPAPGPAAHGSSEVLANQMAAAAPYGWTGGQATCLDQLWNRESGFDASAVNGQSGATGIPQLNPNYYAVPAGWSAPAVQIRWGLSYIARTYGTPCGAWSHEEADNWY